jgi:hypothetical protein
MSIARSGMTLFSGLFARAESAERVETREEPRAGTMVPGSEPGRRRVEQVRRRASAEFFVNPADEGDVGDAGMTTAQLIERILDLNPGATAQYLATFSRENLRDYFDHLHSSTGPRGSCWIRRGDSPGIVGRETPD